MRPVGTKGLLQPSAPKQRELVRELPLCACAAVAGHPLAKGRPGTGVVAAGTPEDHPSPGNGC